MRKVFGDNAHGERAQQIYDRFIEAATIAEIPKSYQEVPFGSEIVEFAGAILQVGVRYITHDQPEYHAHWPFDAQDDFFRFFPGGGWQQLEVAACKIASEYPINGITGIGLFYRGDAGEINEIWLGFKEPI